jgi:ATP adenylyltransferase
VFTTNEEILRMERIWAPWRIEYILAEKPQGCIFCERDGESDRQRLILHRTPRCFVLLNRFPYTNGHLMVAPNRHTADLNDLEEGEMLDLFRTVRLSTNVLQKVAAPQGVNIGVNLGRAAGAGEDEHLHIHIVPRWNGDTNFMSVLSDLRVMPENLLTTYEKLLPVFAACGEGGGS